MTYHENIRAAYADATPDDLAQGLAWYREAHRFARDVAANGGTLTVTRAAGVIAALSPMQGYAQNITLARKLAAHHAAGGLQPMSGYGLTRNTAKAWRILCGERPLDVLSGPKVRAFYRNITGCKTSVTVDRWAVRIALADPTHSGLVPKGEYEPIAQAFRDVAAELGVTARDLQAATWVAYRRLHSRAVYDPPALTASAA